MQFVSSDQSTQCLKKHYTESYLLLAKLALTLTEQPSEINFQVVEEVLSYLVTHCSFCGAPSDLTYLRRGVVQVISCPDCYTKPIDMEIAHRVLNDDHLKMILSFAHEKVETPLEAQLLFGSDPQLSTSSDGASAL